MAQMNPDQEMSEPLRRQVVGLRHQVRRPPIDIEFTDLTYTIPTSRNGSKLILRSVSGLFKSGQLTAILGPSGAGKSTLLNVLAGYRTNNAGGSILINGLPRELRQFKKLSRYIMQEDIHQPMLTIQECMEIAATLKLGPKVPKKHQLETIDEILDMLRLSKSKKTWTSMLSGGEKKRLSIALELLNNPPILFLDEPTTGLDDVSSAQCIKLLKQLARGGRTVVCSIHTPSARLFALFDHAYIVAEGQCVYQGTGEDIVPYLSSLGLHCPKHYNPADFMIEVSSGEYGDYTEKMVMAIDNGRCKQWNRLVKPAQFNKRDSELQLGELKQMPDYGCSVWIQFLVLLKRMSIQCWRDCTYLMLKVGTNVIVGFIIGCLYYQMGNDASKTIFNFGYCFISIIAFLYIPMMPALIWFPQEVKLLKREYFNRWYNLNSYYIALVLSRLPLQLALTMVYIAITYLMTDQPLEVARVSKFVAVSILLTLVSESFGLAISSQLNIVNGIFVGPSLSVPLMLLAVYGLGSGSDQTPILIKIAMHGSYLRFGLEGLITSIYGNDRAQLICPDDEVYCQLKYPKALLKEVGMERAEFWFAFSFLVAYYIIFQSACYLGLKFRLCRNKNLGPLTVVADYVKTHFNIAAQH